ncbi:hypothetical protein HPB50_016951 [Hyalomma asiaticum]|uniref:Uncharacterized protein n=1 Tax=Hyalomma asiaticum TaxID=266040 RepID=A0ACB7TIQ1_HYAAI|nr:hypothetical protein HPB50_016951 [Hyalomma asiaticum]
MPRKAADENPEPPKNTQVKRQPTTEENDAGLSNDASPSKRQRGRPRKDDLAQRGPAKGTATSPAGKLQKAMNASEPSNQNVSATEAASAAAERQSRSRKKGSRSAQSTSSSAHSTPIEAPKRRRVERNSNRGRSRRSPSTRRSGRSRKGASIGSETTESCERTYASVTAPGGSDDTADLLMDEADLEEATPQANSREAEPSTSSSVLEGERDKQQVVVASKD